MMYILNAFPDKRSWNFPNLLIMTKNFHNDHNPERNHVDFEFCVHTQLICDIIFILLWIPLIFTFFTGERNPSVEMNTLILLSVDKRNFVNK